MSYNVTQQPVIPHSWRLVCISYLWERRRAAGVKFFQMLQLMTDKSRITICLARHKLTCECCSCLGGYGGLFCLKTWCFVFFLTFSWEHASVTKYTEFPCVSHPFLRPLIRQNEQNGQTARRNKTKQQKHIKSSDRVARMATKTH